MGESFTHPHVVRNPVSLYFSGAKNRKLLINLRLSSSI